MKVLNEAIEKLEARRNYYARIEQEAEDMDLKMWMSLSKDRINEAILIVKEINTK